MQAWTSWFFRVICVALESIRTSCHPSKPSFSTGSETLSTVILLCCYCGWQKVSTGFGDFELSQGTVHHLCREWAGILKPGKEGEASSVIYSVFFHVVFDLPRTGTSSSQKWNVKFKTRS